MGPASWFPPTSWTAHGWRSPRSPCPTAGAGLRTVRQTELGRQRLQREGELSAGAGSRAGTHAGHLQRSGGGAGASGDAGGIAVQRARPLGQSLGDGEAAPRQPAAAGGHGHPPAGGGSGGPAQRGERRGGRCRYQYAAQPLRRRQWGLRRAFRRSIRSWPSAWSRPWSRWWAPKGFAPACMWSTTSAPARRPRRLTIRPAAVAFSMTRSEERWAAESPGGVPGTSSNLPNAKVTPPAKSGSQTQSSKSESGTYGVNKLVRHTLQPAGQDQAHCGGLAGGRCGRDRAEEQSAHRYSRRKRTAGRDEADRRTGGGGPGHRLQTRRPAGGGEPVIPEPATGCLPAPLTLLEKTAAQRCAAGHGCFRYLALACLFGSVYMLLLRPVKKQLMTTLRELPARTGDRNAMAARVQAPELSGCAASRNRWTKCWERRA